MRLSTLLLCGLLSLPASAQFLDTFASTSGVWAVTNLDGTIQYDIGFDPGAWKPTQQGDVYNFNYIPGMVQILTVNGVSKLYANTSANSCSVSGGCTYKAEFIGPLRQETVKMPNGSTVTRISGTCKGEFSDPTGKLWTGVYGRIYFETAPETDNTIQAEPGELIIELQAY
jgi:hypothetical protein